MSKTANCVGHALVLLLSAWRLCGAQIQIGTVTGSVTDSAGAVLPAIEIVLHNPIAGYHRVVTTGGRGEFAFNNVPFGRYTLKASAAGFQAASVSISVRSNMPSIVDVTLSPTVAPQSVAVNSEKSLIEEDSSSSKTELDKTYIRSRPSVVRSHRLQDLIATAPGWVTENNGLIHIRGVDDGVLYVHDGIPIVDRLDAVSASGFDTDSIDSLEVITGNIPAEFGGRNGAVVTIHPESGIDLPLAGSVEVGAGTFRTREAAIAVGGGFKQKFGFFITTTANRSDRYLDPVDPSNFNNIGGGLNLNARSDWHPTPRDTILVDISGNGADFRVPNDLVQELAGQRQRQLVRDNGEALSWQHVWSGATVTNAAYFRHFFGTKLFGNEQSTPIVAAQDRKHVRQGVIASATHQHKEHTFKAGLELTRVNVSEFFTFAITDEEEAEARDISEAAQEFDLERPFVFQGRKKATQTAAYVEDTFTLRKHLRVSAGLRYDHSNLLTSDQQFSPRLGAVYYITSTRTAIRGSFNRLFMPPQVENLLLSSSEQARKLSPFASDEGGGGATIRPERLSSFEAAVAQDFFGLFKLDAVYWWRFFRNVEDPNVFFTTTVIFPNSVARGISRGIDVRIDVPQRKGWSGYFSYTNMRVLYTGPINGGLFLTEEFEEIGDGTRFIPDQDQRNVGGFGVTYRRERSGAWATFSGRHQSGVPLDVSDERLESLRSAPGADLVNFDRRRVKPWTVFDFSSGANILKRERLTVSAQLSIQNIANKRYAHNFGNPFEGTHFGHPRLWGGRIKLSFY